MADVQKSAFSLSSATIMVAPAFGKDVFSLDPVNDSVGMVSDVKVAVNSNVTKLLNGVAQATVDSKRTGVDTTVTGNVFEFTTQNFMRAQGMSGAAPQIKRGTLTAPLASGAASLSIASNPLPGEPNSAMTAVADIPAGATILIQSSLGTDYVFPTVSSAASTLAAGVFTVPLDTAHQIPATMNFPQGSTVWIVQQTGGGQIDSDDLFGVKVAGVLTNYNRPVVCVFPKVRISKGFEITFSETAYSSMPFEFDPLLLSTVEASQGRLSEVGTKRPFLLYAGS